MKVVVFGASGQVGRCVLQQAPARWNVYSPSSREVNFLVPGHITEYIQAIRPRLIINCAAYTAVEMAQSEPVPCYAINATAVEEMAIAANAVGAAVFHLSTDYVFDGQSAEAYTETCVTHPINVYGSSKRSGEIKLAEHCSEHIILRTSWVFSPFGHNFVNTMLRLAAERTTLAVVSDQFGGPTPASDIARVLIFMASKLDDAHFPYGLFHFSGEPHLSWFEFAREIFSLAVNSGWLKAAPALSPIKALDYQSKVSRPANSRLSNQKILDVFGVAGADWRNGLRHMLYKR
ncbi:dTDP-4-dehydrorhamnose reductase [Shewanella sp.]|uniref:dTDP-4-dehydrorhamnose reductase n=1 Tax=Shewanella sp. TaxID=50422 RepID=UPI0035628C93